MLKRAVVIGSAVALAALILLLTTMFADPATKGKGQVAVAPRANGFGPVTPPTAGSKIPTTGDALDYRFTRVNQRNQLIEVFGSKFSPKPQGVSEVENPGARIHLTPARVLEVRSLEGTFIAPDNQPRYGEFRGKTVLTLFEGPSDRPVKLDNDSPDVKMRIFMADARFDLELGQIESSGEVQLTGPRIDFQGIGLTLTYNEVKGRIERLTIKQGRELRFKPETSPDTEKAGAAATTTKRTAPPSMTRRGDTSKGVKTPQFYRARFEKNIRVVNSDIQVDGQRLEAVFALTQGINASEMLKGAEATPRVQPMPTMRLTSNTLIRMFEQHATLSDATPVVPSIAAPPATTAPSTTAPATAPAKPAATQSTARMPMPIYHPMAKPSPSDLVITWEGTLTMLPEDKPPGDLKGPGDAKLEIVGSPIRIETLRKEVIKADRLEYLASTGKLHLQGRPDQFMTIDSPNLGVLSGLELEIDQVTGVGQILGAGSLVANGNPGIADVLDKKKGMADAEGSPRLPRGMSVKWSDRLDMTFYLRQGGEVNETKPGAPNASTVASGASRVIALKSVAFRGKVEVQHPQFEVMSDILSFDLKDPRQTAQTLEAISAIGNVRIASKDKDPKNLLSIKSDQLEVRFAKDASGKMQPARMLARNHVEAEQAGRKMIAGFLDVTLGPPINTPEGQEAPQLFPTMSVLAPPRVDPKPPEKESLLKLKPLEAPAGGEDKAPKLVVHTLYADQGVQIEIKQPALRIKANRLVTDVPGDKTEIFGSAQEPARVEREEAAITGEYIQMFQRRQLASVTGPGTFEFFGKAPANRMPAPRPKPANKDKDAKEAKDAPAVPPLAAAVADAMEKAAPPKLNTIAILWKKKMTVDNVAGTAEFVGTVRANTRSGKETSQLVSDELKIEFDRDAAAAVVKVDAPAARAEKGNRDEEIALRGRAIKAITATGDVTFIAETWRDEINGIQDTRLTLIGPTLIFNNITQTVKISDVGRMLVEDYRLEKKKPEREGRVEQAGPDVKFSGRGATLFTWAGSLLLDAFNNDMAIDRQVQMVHRPMGSDQVVQMDCQNLLCDLEATGGLGQLFSGNSPKPSVKAIVADRDVLVRADKRLIECDRLEYVGPEQTVYLLANTGKLVKMTDPGSAQPYSATRFRWDLKNNRVEIIQPGAASSPLSR